MIDHKPLAQIFSRLDTVLLGTLLLTTSLFFGITLGVGEFWWTDESRHAMDGVYFLDLMRDRPFSGLYDYTVQYFARYPALGFTWYPPFFALVEGFVFAVFGVSEFTARLTVLLFCLLGITAWYLWARPIWGSITAFCAGLFFLVNPYVLLWGRSVMLEIPAVAMILLALLCFHYYLRRPSHTRSILAGLVIGCMLLTKQTTAFILPVFITYAFLAKAGTRLWVPKSIWAYAITACALAVLLVHATIFGSTALGGFDQSIGSLMSEQTVERLFLSGKAIFGAYPLPLLLIATVGFIAAISPTREPRDLFVVFWVIAWYVFFTLISSIYNNTLRYTIYLTPAMGFLAARALQILPDKPLYTKLSTGVLIALYAGFGYAALRYEQPTTSGYELAAQFVLNEGAEGTILFCCKHDGNFTFHIRRGDLERKQVVVRADKVLVSMAVQKSFGVQSYVRNSRDIYDLLDRYGVGTVVAEDKDLVGLPEFRLLLETLDSDRFEKLNAIDLVTNVPDFEGVKLRIFRYKDRKPIEGGEIVIPMPHIGREVRLPVE